MNLQIYISDNFSKYYLPFILYRDCVNTIMNAYLSVSVEYIYDINSFTNNSNTIIICSIYDININIINILSSFISKKIIFNTEYYKNCNTLDKLNKINNENLNFFIFEYNILNIRYYKEIYNNIKYYFLPLCYDIYLEQYYNSNINNKINFKHKDIDIFFYGSVNERRNHILNKLKNKYNVVIIQGSTGLDENKEICNLIERSKIILNILHYDTNIIFDYYRNSFLIANKVFLISESANDLDYLIEDGLKELTDNLIMSKYENIIETIDQYYNINENEYYNIINRQYESFKKYNMKDKIIDFYNRNII